MARKTSSTVNLNICTGKKTPVMSAKAASAFIERGKQIKTRVARAAAEKYETKR